jgi:hypothetical protein
MSSGYEAFRTRGNVEEGSEHLILRESVWSATRTTLI